MHESKIKESQLGSRGRAKCTVEQLSWAKDCYATDESDIVSTCVVQLGLDCSLFSHANA